MLLFDTASKYIAIFILKYFYISQFNKLNCCKSHGCCKNGINERRSSQLITPLCRLCMLDTLKPTAAGLDAIPAWFLRVGAPVFAAPLAELFNESIAAGIVPWQWKLL